MPLTPVAEVAAQPLRLGSLDTDPSLWAVVFAGGIGSRFWPLSSHARPKPALQLLGDKPLLAETVQRLAPLIPPDRILVMTAQDIAAPVKAAIPEIPAHNLLIEPQPLGTAASLAWALDVIARRGGASGVVCALHADLAAAFPIQFREAVRRATATALRERALVALGVPPTRAETSFGYLVPGEPLDATVPVGRGGAARAERFVEKPTLDVVVDLLHRGAFWHSGVVVGKVADVVRELHSHATELAPGRAALASGDVEGFTSKVRSVSIERGLLERMPDLVVQPMECGWDDVGTWACLRRARDLDDHGNGAIGEAYFVDATSNVVHTESGTVVLFGCDRLLVVTLPGLTFVTPLDKAADLRPLLDQLPAALRSHSTRPNP